LQVYKFLFSFTWYLLIIFSINGGKLNLCHVPDIVKNARFIFLYFVLFYGTRRPSKNILKSIWLATWCSS